MFSIKHQKFILALFVSAISFLNIPVAFAQQKHFDKIVVFGASLEDSGNAFVILSDPTQFGFDEASCDLGTPINVPHYEQLDDLYIPDGVYAKGGHHITNGATWVENLARSLALAGSARPALRNGGPNASNFAVGGARALDFDCRFNLSDQLAEYFARFPQSSSDTLFIFDIGGNDLRDMMVGLVPPTEIETIMGNIQDAITTLYYQGARHFLIVNMPDFGQTPAEQKLHQLFPFYNFPVIAGILTQEFNYALSNLQIYLSDLPGIEISLLDLYALFNSIFTTPEDFGLLVTDATCVTPEIAPYTCTNPGQY